MSITFHDKVALVTGAGTGIGRATAVTLARYGAKVAVAGRRADLLAETVRMIEDCGSEALALPTDVADEAQVRAMVEATVERFGALDVACNNAGIIGPMAPIVDLSAEDFDLTLATNLRGAFLCLKHELAVMAARGAGAVVNVSSVNAVMAEPSGAGYCTSKAGLDMLTRVAALEHAAQGIRVNSLRPGYVLTPMHDARARRRRWRHPGGRRGDRGIGADAPPGRAGGDGRGHRLALLPAVGLRHRPDPHRGRWDRDLDVMMRQPTLFLTGRLIQIGLRALELGNNVVIDYGLWGRDERSALRQAAADLGAMVEMRYFELTPAEQRRRLDHRQAEAPHTTWPMSDEDLARDGLPNIDIPTPGELDGSVPIDDPPAGVRDMGRVAQAPRLASGSASRRRLRARARRWSAVPSRWRRRGRRRDTLPVPSWHRRAERAAASMASRGRARPCAVRDSQRTATDPQRARRSGDVVPRRLVRAPELS